MDENPLEFTPVPGSIVDKVDCYFGIGEVKPEHPADTFDRMTKDGYKLNLITGEYAPTAGGHLEGK